MTKARFIVFGGIAVVALLLAMTTVYAYGKWFSHDRYWRGTIERVQTTETALIRSLLKGTATALPDEVTALARVFAPLDGLVVVEVWRDGTLRYSNFNERFTRGRELDTISLSGGQRVRLLAYQPPTWEYNFCRWLWQPERWFEPSFDHITMPFLWFLSLYSLALLTLGFVVKSGYLERDVIAVLRQLDRQNTP